MRHPLIRLMRPGDWVKNVFVLIPLVFWAGERLGRADVEPGLLLAKTIAAAVAFASFCLVSSGFYSINDAADAEVDRRHPLKRRRPVAAGEIAPRTAMIFGSVLVVAALALTLVVKIDLTLTLVLYVLLQAAYNIRLKRAMIVDVVTVAIGFALRAVGGAVAIDVQISIWLLACVFFLCLYLGFVKRLCDLSAAEGAADSVWEPPAGYRDRAELGWLLGISAVLAIMTYLTYTLSAHAGELFGARALGLSLLTPLVIIAVHRFYRRAQAGLSDSPLAALREDRAVRAAIVLFVIGTVVTLYVAPVEEVLSRVFLAVTAEPAP